jgi:cellulose synthase (UDP-forming)
MKKLSVYSETERFINYGIIAIWVLIFIDFCVWWFSRTQVTHWLGYAAITFTVFWLPVLHIYFYFFSLRQKEHKKHNKLPKGRVALITSKVPSESKELLVRTLEAMLAQKLSIPHDVWVLDEDPTDEMKLWCRENKVRISSRKGVEKYNRATYPGKARVKEGNFNYFFDTYGYVNYDFVIQFDADHSPEPDFAFEVLKEFNDPTVGYVSSPSIIDGNIEESWTIKARSFWEATTHGPIQSGSNDGFAPMMFGSHYSHRVKALKEIGGLGPEYAEDHTTTLIYNAHGWKGGFARHAIAHGYGAVGLVDSMLQEHQWAMVGMRAALLITPKYFMRLSWRVKIQFIIWELWYPALTLVSALSIFLPIIAIYTHQSYVLVESQGFLNRYLWLNGIFILYGFWLKVKDHFRPINSWHISFETMIFQYLQLPWIVIGWIQGLIQVMKKEDIKKYKITDKDETVKHMPIKFFLPHALIILITALALIFNRPNGENSDGYAIFVVITMASYTISLVCGVYLSVMENISKIHHTARLPYLYKNSPTIALSLSSLFASTLAVLMHYYL